MAPLTHGVHSKTFSQPPLDGSLCLPELLDLQGSRCGKHPLFVYEDAPNMSRIILWEEAIKGIHRATEYIRRAISQNNLASRKPVIAVLASSDTITFSTFLSGALRTGWTVFPISTRNSVPAISALLKQTQVTHLFTTGESHIQQNIAAAIKELPEPSSVVKCCMPVFEDLYPTKGVDPNFVPSRISEFDLDDTAIIIHSSGTTAFPKPVNLTHRALLSWIDGACHSDVDFAGCVFSYHSVPVFHALGITSIAFSTGCGLVVAAFKPQTPAVVPNPDNVFQQASATNCDFIFTTPTMIETWAQTDRTVQSLTNIKGVIYGGGPLGKECGDYLASRGVNIYTAYGLTQTLLVSNFLPKPPGMDWEFCQVSRARPVDYIDRGNNEFELVLLATESYTPSVINTEINGKQGFATNDLVMKHPTKEGYFRIIGRTDDQIMHSTGEKTNPGPLEKILNQDPLVSDALMFGRGRFHCGVLVQPKPPFSCDPTNSEELLKYRSLIWPTIEKMNEFAPSHSRLFKEMIIVASPCKPFTYTAKGSPRRQATLDDYAAEIESAYAAVDESSQDDIPGPTDWTLTSTEKFIRTVVERTMKTQNECILNDADLFELGLDSLQATWIRNSILRALRETNQSASRSIPASFVYDHPTISRLSRFIHGVVAGALPESTDSKEAKRAELRSLIEKYTQTFPEFKGGKLSQTDGAVVLLTGSTGSLGSNILAKLLQNPGVKCVYTLSRPSSNGISAKERHVKAFEREALDVKLLDGSKVLLLEGDASRADFSVDKDAFAEMQTSVTHIIHNGWRVNFNVAVSSFESNIRSVRNFIDFSLGGSRPVPARIIFISSIGVFQSFSEKQLGPESHMVEPDGAIGTGYAESKWVSEQILQRASIVTPLSTTVARCGQMTGGPSGAWNEHEWFPSLVKSSVAMGKLPNAGGIVTWINTHDAAGAVVDMLDVKDEVLNIVHPRPVSWSSVISTVSEILGIPVVPYTDWLHLLEKAAKSTPSDSTSLEAAHRSNPALRLLSFFQGSSDVPDEYKEALRFPRMTCEKATAASQAMQKAKPLGEEDAKRWIESWRRSEFL
ncbi:acetyl-CoA synthetase-like protein [Fomitiporia mediterranea MF3/22]|uniref:acetyl-CoA synthetase-like protein n=1 Tax=Fomitiporia mediterranea (strain MF3/22) TaxID=694068 RepID=UPI0004407BCC|nr:acetyl-CoA synthetase-like protein [Fomitiporia mediterranea MF3/22]EJC99103.1 acetyl-CoA synthetase-like protein [Fomitiporia mediterranea MF3/22]